MNNNRRVGTQIIREIFFILFIVASVVYFLSLITNSPLENPYSSSEQLDGEIINKAGIIGAYLSDFSLAMLGYASYLIPIALVWTGWEIRRNSQKTSSIWLVFIRLISFIIFLLFSATLLSIKTENPFENTGDIAGGDIGYSMHAYFSVLFGSTSTLIYVGIIMISFAISGVYSWSNIFNLIGKFLLKIPQKIKQIFSKKNSEKPNKNYLKPKNASQKPDNTPKIKPKENKNNNQNYYKSSYKVLPNLSLLSDINNKTNGYSKQDLIDISKQVELKLKDFGFDVTISNVTPGPVVTQFEISLAPGVKVSQIMNLNKDLARALLVESVRIVDVIPGKPVIGLEIPNIEKEIISLKDIFSSDEFSKSKSVLTMGLGKNINNNPVVADLAKMPHLLVAGATGMGKSVGINCIILSILYKANPDQVRMIMIDPKIVELACYADIPHLLTPVITDMNLAANSLFWCINEMERRYLLLSKLGVRNIEGFNDKIKNAKAKGEKILDPLFESKNQEDKAKELETLPFIVIIIDEYADMLGALAQEDRTKSKRVEMFIVRLAQKARASGIHLIISTQRPSVDVITGLIKSNIPTRIAFKVSSKVDSRTILDQGGAEQLLGMGDMLYTTPGVSHLTRVHGAFVDDDEITKVVNHLKANSSPDYLENIVNTVDKSEKEDEFNSSQNDGNGELDDLYNEAVKIVTSSGRASISSLQRRLRIGYNRSARIIEDMEKSGVVSPMNSAGNRQVLAPKPIEDE
jgi:S-DNA-T family DNA segregation ATPase FtsK/SpoIIIE